MGDFDGWKILKCCVGNTLTQCSKETKLTLDSVAIFVKKNDDDKTYDGRIFYRNSKEISYLPKKRWQKSKIGSQLNDIGVKVAGKGVYEHFTRDGEHRENAFSIDRPSEMVVAIPENMRSTFKKCMKIKKKKSKRKKRARSDSDDEGEQPKKKVRKQNHENRLDEIDRFMQESIDEDAINEKQLCEYCAKWIRRGSAKSRKKMMDAIDLLASNKQE